MERLVINNGVLIDPLNQVNSRLNLAVEGGRVVEISPNNLKGHREIDASGLIVCPGFVDIHMHEDKYIEAEDRFDITIFDAMARMGVTTAIGGNCGIGPDNVLSYIDGVRRQGLPVNLGMLIPHESLRKAVGANDKYSPASRDQIARMKALAGDMISKGFLGISFGIEYIPGITREELVEISSVCKPDKLVAAHIRGDADLVMDGLEELISVGRENNLRLEVSHIGSMAGYGQMEEVLAYIDSARAGGLRIGVDCYPYNAFSTKIGTAPFDDGFLERYDIGYESVEIAQGTYKGRRCNEEIFKELRRESPQTMAIGHVMDEEEIDLAISHPNVVIASDGTLNSGQGHPRAGGSFPRLISEYVKKKNILKLDEAIGKMTYKPARNIGINKGSLGLGDDGDIVIFNLDKIRDRANFQDPLLPPEGIEYVLIGGEIVVRKNSLLNRNRGRLVE